MIRHLEVPHLINNVLTKNQWRCLLEPVCVCLHIERERERESVMILDES